jgi:HlyD family secretion protein
MRKVFKFILFAVLFSAFGYTFYFLYQKSKPKQISYNTEKPFVTNIYKNTVATGSIKPEEEVDIKPQVSGIISKLYVQEGDMLKTGDLIAEVKIIPDLASLNNAEARVETAKLTLENAKRDFDRNKDLYNSKVISESEFQTFENNYFKAKNDLDAAVNNLDIVKKGSSSKFTSTANTLVKSTVSGMVLEVPVKKGNQVIQSNNFNEGTTIAAIADMNKMIFEGKIDESEVGKLKVGMPLILQIGAIEDVTFDAVLSHIAPKGKSENGAVQFLIEAEIDLREDYFIRSGYSANANIVLEKRENVLAVNESLIQFDQGKNSFVEVKNPDGSYSRVDVQLGMSDGIKVEVQKGVNLDDEIKVWNRPI